MVRLTSFLALLGLLTSCSSSAPENAKALQEAQKAAADATQRAEAAEKKLAEATAPKTPEPAPPSPVRQNAEAPAPTVTTLPAGSPVAIRTTTLISSKAAKEGDTFAASLEQPIVVRGVVIAPKGADATLRVTSVDEGGRVKGRASIALALVSFVDASGRQQTVSSAPVTTLAKSGVKKDVLKTGAAAGVGAAIGAIAGGGKGAAIGAGAGAAGGTGVVLATRGPAAEVPAESVLRFTTGRAVRVTR